MNSIDKYFQSWRVADARVVGGKTPTTAWKIQTLSN